VETDRRIAQAVLYHFGILALRQHQRRHRVPKVVLAGRFRLLLLDDNDDVYMIAVPNHDYDDTCGRHANLAPATPRPAYNANRD
jgi:hypothetical protein